MAIETPPDVLPCGRDPLDVLDCARLGRTDPHMLACQYCQAVIAADEPARFLAQNVRSEPVRVPDTLLPAVMSTVWSELRPGRRIPLPALHGSAFATEQSVVSMLEHDLDLLDDFLVHLCSLEVDDDPSDGLSGETFAGATDATLPAVRVDVRAAAAYSADLSVLAEIARAQAATTLLVQFGLIAASIDIHFLDVYRPESSRR